MTIKELIEKLSKFAPDKIVVRGPRDFLHDVYIPIKGVREHLRYGRLDENEVIID